MQSMARTKDERDTIAAAATPPGAGAIAVVRVCGPRSVEIGTRLTGGRPDLSATPSHKLVRAAVMRDGERIDDALFVAMRAPNSYTGEDMVEVHCHGGPLIARSVLEAAIALGARPAEPGEFTRRAYLNGRMDLARAEAVAELIAGSTEAAARAALHQLGGGLSKELSEVRDRLADALARLEASIDFSDSDDVPEGASEETMEALSRVTSRLDGLLAGRRRGALLRDGARVVIAGRPNVGKSTLMNRLLGKERVIVTAEPGATRDVVEDMMDLAGVPVRLFDTAGLRAAAEEAERAGVERARQALRSADLALLVIDRAAPLRHDDREIASELTGPCVVVLNKSDLSEAVSCDDALALVPGAKAVVISALNGAGMDELMETAAETLGAVGAYDGDVLVSARHGEALERVRASVRQAAEAIERGMSEEFPAADLREALDALGEITGETATDEILDRVFSRFCVGK